MIAFAENAIASKPTPRATGLSGERPLMSVGAAAFVLSFRQSRVEYAIENGKLPCFDIRLESSRRTCLRLFSPAVGALKNDAGFVTKLSLAEMIEAILPPGHQTFPQEILAWRFHTSGDHIANLCDSRSLAEGGRRTDRGGRNISRASAAKFLAHRRVS